MSADDLDEVMRRLAPPVEVSPERALRVMDAVMARLDERSMAAAPRPSFGGGLRGGEWLAGLLPFSRFALPMAAAVLLGIVVGHDLRADTETVVLGQDLVTTYYSGLGY
ncbi:protein of unknown function [Magnetospirillum sp. XM-1]|uniref:hypothetical protein n=1 Tax=Magnetospirillum sp. XM-1 TaxID=1663591 RepID=UPI00073DCC2A|nr:hypothetical protein [Magnetospirillum sp. XM-1]CUW40723.1 protein of unknown function [Magnetospirillum sp. XM-1]